MGGFRALIVFAVVPMLAAVVALLFMVESPRFLLMTGRPDQAMNSLRTIAKRNKVSMPCERLLVPEGVVSDAELANRGPIGRYWIYLKRYWRSLKNILSRKLWKRTLLI